MITTTLLSCFLATTLQQQVVKINKDKFFFFFDTKVRQITLRRFGITAFFRVPFIARVNTRSERVVAVNIENENARDRDRKCC